MARKAKLEIVKNEKGKQRWWYRLKGGNGEIMWQSEKFSSHATCINMCLRSLSHMQNIQPDEVKDTTL